MNKPDCYECKHVRSLPGDAHKQCVNNNAKVTGNETGIRNGWFFWPFNFDPIWVIECNGFEEKEEQ